MSKQQERAGRAIARAIQGLEFDAKVHDTDRVDAELEALGVGGARVEVRHPHARTRDGRRQLVGIVSLEGRVPEVVYAVPVYRDALVRAVARIVGGAG